jgi:hypothetical protein
VRAVWLTAAPSLLRERIRTAGDYRGATAAERYLMDQFLARSIRYQELMVAQLAALGLPRLDVGEAGPEELADHVLAAAADLPASG